MNETTVWILKKGSEKKFRSGHPWVFSNELAQSPKGLAPGGLVELRDYNGGFLARGYGHPNSLIAFRTLCLDSSRTINTDFIVQRLRFASEARRASGLKGFSHRLCFAENDDLPGLVIDRYFLARQSTDRMADRRADRRDDQRAGAATQIQAELQVFVVQSSTAGMDRLLPLVFEAIEQLVLMECEDDLKSLSWEATSIVLANDSKSRALEGIPVESKKIIRAAEGFVPSASTILAQASLEKLPPVTFEVDFIGGQKTGFFLDQRLNVHLAARIVEQLAQDAVRENRPLRVLDLFCYVGQWGTQLAHLATMSGAKAEITLVDASAQALAIAGRNVEAHGGIARIEKRDVLEELGVFERKAFDVVICDPPAFVKKKKDLPTGTQAYFKVNREAIRKTRRGGLFVSCSCSGLFDETEFRSMLARVNSSFDGRARWIARGSHGVDHPQRPEFPQGTYLKSWMGVIE